MALSKIFTLRYYAQNTGFFLLLFYFFFGIVPGGQILSYHYTLIKGFTGSLDFLALVCFIWLLYNLKCMMFILNALSAKEHLFLYGTIGLLEGSRKWKTWYWLHLTLYTPVLVYSGLAVLVALKLQFYPQAVIILLFNVLMTIFPLWFYDRKVKHPGTTSFLARWQHRVNKTFRKPLWLIYIYELLNNNIKTLAISKGASLLVIILTCSLMGGEYDERYILTGFLVCLLLQSLIVYNHRHFDDLYLSLLPQLPLALWKRYLQMGLTYLLLLAPEYILLIYRIMPAAAPLHLLLIVVLGVSVLMLLRSLLYFPGIDQDKYFRWLLLIIVGLLFLTLARLYWYGVLVMQLSAYAVFLSRYYRYEAPLEKVD
ncbi:hypothetical protein [Chitinophaga tropicalis]|uniref:Uncharacterized protein n=1 Tax=Chitinophaga tropicalis TaxID=2683588 RepID=A0A7K1U761_9BACT|nr:hypothetical protein [Chitinophaga tropicalis]MVT10126.1 hypothetical protein [Chitinophaga tropicalis]